MFSLKAHARRGAKVVVVGAVASAAWASIAQAATLNFDPGLTPATPSGGSGSFDNSTANFSNGATDVAPTATDDVHFGAPGGTVTVPNGTLGAYNVPTGGVNVQSLTIDANGYIFNPGTGMIILHGGSTDASTILSLTAGNATFNAPISGVNGDATFASNINVAPGSTLTLNNLTNGSYGSYSSLRKVGAGTLKFTGTFSNTNAFNQFFIDEGNVVFAGQSNNVAGGITIATGAGLSGDATVSILAGRFNVNARGYNNASVFQLNAGAHLAPGANTSGNFGATGTFGVKGPGNSQYNLIGQLAAGSNLDIDINSTGAANDKLQLTGGTYGMGTMTIEQGAVVNINAIGALATGTYNIVTGAITGAYGLPLGVNHCGFLIGTAPAGFEYNFQEVVTNNQVLGNVVDGVNLVVTTPTAGSTWSGGTGVWSTGTNWAGGSPNATGTTATFNGSTTAAVNVDSAKTVGRILLSGTNYTFSGSALTLDNTGGNGANALIRASSNSHTFNSAVVTAGTNLDIRVGAGAALNFVGGIDNTAGKVVALHNAGGTLTLPSMINNGTLVSTGDATAGNISGSGRLLVTNGTLTLNTPSSYTGGTTLTGGILSIDSLDKIGTGNITFYGGTLRVTGTTLNSIDGRISVVSGIPGAIFNGTLDIADPNNTFTVATSLGQYNGYVVKTGAGTAVFTGTGARNPGAVGMQVKQGTVLVNGTLGNNYASVLLNGGTLGGSGTIGNAAFPGGYGVVGGSGPHTIYPSATLAPGTTTNFNVSRLATNANTTLKFNLVTPAVGNGPSVNDTLTVFKNNRTSIAQGGIIAPGSTSTGAASLGFYKVISYVGSLDGTGTDITPTVIGNIEYYADTVQHPGFIDIHRGFLGDANDDGTVNFFDFVQLSNHYGQLNARWPGGDFNSDGVTNFSDFVILSNHYGKTIAGGQIVATPDELAAMNAFAAANGVPEPASLSLLAVGTLALLNRRKRRH
jgi:fibronectin-binding autotransporter adhesin